MSLARNISDLPNGDDAPVYACRAWVNFNGTGTVAIQDSGNVASITDNGTGDYTVNFATAMPDANYTTVISFGYDSGGSGSGWWLSRIVSTGTTGVQIYSGRQDNYVRVDATNANLSIFH